MKYKFNDNDTQFDMDGTGKVVKSIPAVHTFELPLKTENAAIVQIQYVQRGKSVISLSRSDVIAAENKVTAKLTGTQTSMFTSGVPLLVQIVVTALDGNVYASTEIPIEVRGLIPHESKITCREVFNRAIYLMAENDDLTGKTETADTTEYKVRTIGILNMLIGECFPYSDTFAPRKDGKRPVLSAVTDMDETTGLDDFIAGTVLPYGLAAKLYIAEDTTQASFFHQRYQELLVQARNVPAMPEDIEDVYGYDSVYNEFSRW